MKTFVLNRNTPINVTRELVACGFMPIERKRDRKFLSRVRATLDVIGYEFANKQSGSSSVYIETDAQIIARIKTARRMS